MDTGSGNIQFKQREHQYLYQTIIQSDIDATINLRPNESTKPLMPMEIAKEIDTNMNPEKSPEIDNISPIVFKELTRKAEPTNNTNPRFTSDYGVKIIY